MYIFLAMKSLLLLRSSFAAVSKFVALTSECKRINNFLGLWVLALPRRMQPLCSMAGFNERFSSHSFSKASLSAAFSSASVLPSGSRIPVMTTFDFRLVMSLTVRCISSCMFDTLLSLVADGDCGCSEYAGEIAVVLACKRSFVFDFSVFTSSDKCTSEARISASSSEVLVNADCILFSSDLHC